MMVQTDWKRLEEKIGATVKLSRRPVAVSFLDVPPLGVKKFEGDEPSSCSFWRLAADGAVFYALPENHFNCAVGAYTHNIALPLERENEAEQTLKMMFDLDYIKPQEVVLIPRVENKDSKDFPMGTERSSLERASKKARCSLTSTRQLGKASSPSRTLITAI